MADENVKENSLFTPQPTDLPTSVNTLELNKHAVHITLGCSHKASILIKHCKLLKNMLDVGAQMICTRM